MTAKTLTRKLPEMTDEVASMISLRHSAEQRGHFEPLGRLQWINTEHGLIRFPAMNGDGCGPDLAEVNKQELISSAGGDPDLQRFMSDNGNPYLIVLGHW